MLDVGCWLLVVGEVGLIRTDDIAMAALSGASAHYDFADGLDSDRHWRRAYSILGRACPLADGHRIGALAFVRGSLVRGLVSQLAAPSYFHGARLAGGCSRWGVVRWRRRSGYEYGSDR